jgi:ubiquinone biosynthesis protein
MDKYYPPFGAAPPPPPLPEIAVIQRPNWWGYVAVAILTGAVTAAAILIYV